jgi:capsular exopolysaccharide synthesis family protein
MNDLQLYPARQLAEQFEILKCRIVNMMAGKNLGPFVLAFTSCEPGEGVTNVAVNFAAAMVHDRRSHVLLVDGNMNKPGLHRYFAAHGQSNGNRHEEKAPVKSSMQVEVLDWQILQANPNLDVILTQHIPDNYHRTYRMAEISNFLNCAKDKYEYVIIDCPPLNRSSGASILSSRADAVVLVVEAERVRREVIQRSIGLLDDLGANVLGVVLNKRRYPIPGFIYNML